METISCPICKSNNFNDYLFLYDRYDLKNKKKFSIVKCLCNFIYLNPRPNKNEIAKYYRDISYSPHNEYSFFYKIAQKISFKWKYNFIKKNFYFNKILDYGSGKGDFGDYMNARGYDVTNYDPITSNINTSNLKFELITMWHSLEHVHDLKKTFNELNEKLSSNGHLLIAVPNISAAEKKYLNTKWVAFDVPRHLYHFDQKSLGNLLNSYGFKIDSIKPIYQDTIFNIYKSLNIYNMIYFPFIFFISMIQILLNKSKSSSQLFVCSKI